MIREGLEREGLAENTVIIFTSDNGYNSGSHGFGDKVIPYEEGSKSPLIIYDPRLPKQHAGKVSEAVTAQRGHGRHHLRAGRSAGARGH